MRKFLTGIAAIATALCLISIGWFLHPDSSQQAAKTASTTTVISPSPVTTHAAAGKTQLDSLHKAPSTYAPTRAHEQTLRAAGQSQLRPAGHNINPNAPLWTSSDTTDTPIDRNLALNLFADKIAKEEYGEENDADTFDEPHLRRKLETALPNADVTAELRADLDSWWAQLPPQEQPHVAIALAECRGHYCRILIAVNSIKSRVVGNSSVWEFASGVSFGVLQDSLLSQPWLKAMDSGGFTYSESPGQQVGYLLFSMYFKLPKAA